jgi:hypothetical protein
MKLFIVRLVSSVVAATLIVIPISAFHSDIHCSEHAGIDDFEVF